MPSLAQILLPLAMLLPTQQGPMSPVGAGDGAPPPFEENWRLAEWPAVPAGIHSVPDRGPARQLMAKSWQPRTWQQVRIEQRLIIRIVPRSSGRDMLAAIPPPPLPDRLVERRAVRCLPVAGIAGVQVASDDRLLLFMRDQRMVGANLDKACNARDFYSGFYLERTDDGMLCAGRDVLHSRAGTNCSVSELRELVPDN